ncbi:hypothetical protein VMCG_06181 [Cytospora schulzeri]|uniref:Cupin type-2 domain-containing protein n=1 Tax=Cytospora schulzeri TaxID=448051 RepID=A0A423W9A3_9PEZI|nr:hypothetical protein VMCG_06181 [Valsa malicola]
MADSNTQPPPSNLRQPSRFITDHNDQGLAVFNTTIPEPIPAQATGAGPKFYLGYTTSQTPTDFTDNGDVASYSRYLADPPGIVIPGGSVCRIVDMPPGSDSPMHRTVSLDYGVVLEGEIELVLDSGETRLLKRGDVAIQRGTNHMWTNTSKTEWGRMLYVLQESKPIEIGGKKLGEDYGVGMGNVKPSGS